MRQPPHPPREAIVLTEVLAALADPVRLAIVARLAAEGETGCGEIEAPVARSTISHHLKVLREAGIAHHRSEGTRVFLTLRPELEEAFPGLLASVLRHASGAG